MSFKLIGKLGTNIEIGQQILTKNGWEKVTSKFKDGIVTNKGTEVIFGDTIYGWKIK